MAAIGRLRLKQPLTVDKHETKTSGQKVATLSEDHIKAVERKEP